MRNIEKNLIYFKKNITDALQCINDISEQYTHEPLALFVFDDNQKVIGSLTDGDIRRNILKNRDLESTVESFMNPDFKFLREYHFTVDDIAQFREKNISMAPVLDSEYRLIHIIDLTRKKTVLPADAFLMAGGKGTRLRPLTDDTPKPMLKLGNKPIIEYNIDRLIKYGIENFYISINYLGEQIREYLGDGSDKGINIHYIEETQPLGTLGSMTLVDDFYHEHILLMNSDLLTTINFENFYRDFIAKDTTISVASIPYDIRIPYAVFELNGDGIKSFKEKPEYTYHSNAGIYMLHRKLVDQIPRNTSIDVTDFMEQILSNGNKISYFPILGYWLDIGKHSDFNKAQNDIHLLDL